MRFNGRLLAIRVFPFGLIFLLYPLLSPATTIRLVSTDLDKNLWIANAVYQTNLSKDWSLPILADLTAKILHEHPDVDYTTLKDSINEVREKYRQEIAAATASNPSTPFNSTPAQTLSTLLDIFGSIPSIPYVGELAKTGQNLLKLSDLAYQSFLTPLDQEMAEIKNYQNYQFNYNYGKDAFLALQKEAELNPNAIPMINGIFATALNAPIGSTREDLLDPTRNASFATAWKMADLSQFVAADGLHISDEQVNGLLDKIKKQLDGIAIHSGSKLLELPQKVDLAFEYLHQSKEDAERAKQLAASLELERAKIDLELKGIQSSVNILSILVGGVDRRAGEIIGTVGNSLIQANLAFNDYVVTSSKFVDGTSQLMSTSILTSNLVGIGLQIVRLFNSGPSEFELINRRFDRLEEMLKGLSRQVANFAETTNLRFNQVDRLLREVISEVSESFNKIQEGLFEIQGDIDSMQISLQTLHLKLDRLQMDLDLKFESLGLRDFHHNLVSCTQYPESEADRRSFESFWECLSYFYTAGSSDAYDAISTDQNKTVDEMMLASSLDRPLSREIGFLGVVANDLIKVPLAKGRRAGVANPLLWSIASEAYLQTALKYPEHLKKISRMSLRGQLKELIQTGEDLKTTMQSIKLSAVHGRPQEIDINWQFFKSLLNFYNVKAENAKAELNRYREDFVSKRYNGVDIFNTVNLVGSPKGLPQKFSSISACADSMIQGTKTLNRYTPQLWNSEDIFDQLAGKLGLIELHPCYSIHIVRTRDKICNKADRDPIPMMAHGEFVDWTTEVRVQVTGPGGVPLPQGSIYLKTAAIKGITRTVEGTPLRVDHPHWEACPNLTVDRYGELPPMGESTSFERMMAKEEYIQLGSEKAWEHLWQPPYETLTKDEKPTAEILIGEIQKVFDRGVAEFQIAILEELRGATALSQAFTKLDGAKRLLESMLVLGLPQTIERNESLHSLLWGADPLVDSKYLKEVITDYNPSHPRTWDSMIFNDLVYYINFSFDFGPWSGRNRAFENILYKALEEDKNPEVDIMIESTLSRLQAFKKTIDLK